MKFGGGFSPACSRAGSDLANDHFQRGVETVQLPSDRVPRLADVNRRLEPPTGFQAKPVSGYVPGFLFLRYCAAANFPLHDHHPRRRTAWITFPNPISSTTLPATSAMAERAFADVLIRFGRLRLVVAAALTAEIRRLWRACPLADRSASWCAMSCFFWFTVEFWPDAAGGVTCRFALGGSGLLSLGGESQHLPNRMKCSATRCKWSG